MCGRLNIQVTQLTKLLMAILQEEYPGDDNPNAAPTETLPVLRAGDDGQIQCVPMRWWLTPSWSQGPSTRYSMFNAKAETAARSPAFRGPFAKQRCVVPVSGFYEWQRRAGHKQPFFISDQAQEGLLLAGLWDAWQPRGSAGETAEHLSFTLLTTAAHPSLDELHHRQPVFLRPEQAGQWLDPQVETSALKSLLASDLPVPLQLTPVSNEVNSARNKSPRCYYPVGSAFLASAEVAFAADSLTTIQPQELFEQENIIVDT